jgi:YHS domain-containing protein
MSFVKDPVCGMDVDPARAPDHASHQGATYHFCSPACVQSFLDDPARYAGELERHEPPYTVSRYMAAPKFGAAGSGGLENEAGPERHDRS